MEWDGKVLGEKGYGDGTTRIYVLLIVPISRHARSGPVTYYLYEELRGQLSPLHKPVRL
jgi:hypothetical protein